MHRAHVDSTVPGSMTATTKQVHGAVNNRLIFKPAVKDMGSLPKTLPMFLC
ncbi:MAG: hypothetical protein ACYC9U_15105 [Nitrososphaerales archaeon]